MTQRAVPVLTALAVAAVTAVAGAEASAQSSTRTLPMTFDVTIGGTHQGETVRGRVAVRIPRTWERRDRLTPSPLLLEADDDCTPAIRLDVRATATRTGAGAQVRRSTRLGGPTVDKGGTASHAWRIVETERAANRRGFYGVAAIRVARHRWLHLRALVSLAPSCNTQYDAKSELVSTLARYLSTQPRRARIR